MICPAVMLAKSRIINAKGFVKMPRISHGIIIGYSAFGTGGNKMCIQYPLFPLTLVIIKVQAAKTKVKAMFPVKLAPIGIIPNTLLIKIKKKTVKRYGVNFSLFGPMLSLAISSRTKVISGSKKDCFPFGAE